MITEQLSPEYESLRGEIVDSDIYKMRDKEDIVSVNDPNYIHVKGHKRPFNFTPDVIFDLGACFGFFSGYCRSLFPDAYVVAVEPNLENCKQFLSINKRHENLLLINKAIGNGKVWRSTTSKNGAGENYISESVAYPENEIIKQPDTYEVSEVQTISLSELINIYVEEGQKFIVKIDIEAAESFIYTNEKEMEALKKADYITGELHFFSINGETNKVIKERIEQSLVELSITHNIERKGLNFYAVKK